MIGTGGADKTNNFSRGMFRNTSTGCQIGSSNGQIENQGRFLYKKVLPSFFVNLIHTEVYKEKQKKKKKNAEHFLEKNCS